VDPLAASGIIVEFTDRTRNRAWRAPEILGTLDEFADAPDNALFPLKTTAPAPSIPSVRGNQPFPLDRRVSSQLRLLGG
jgi:hypothetical protein